MLFELGLMRIDKSHAVFQRIAADLAAVAGRQRFEGRQEFLVDEVGGLSRAIEEARRRAGLPADAPVRELSAGRRELPPALATAPATLNHALEIAAAFNMSAVWWLCPLAGLDL